MSELVDTVTEGFVEGLVTPVSVTTNWSPALIGSPEVTVTVASLLDGTQSAKVSSWPLVRSRRSSW